MMATKDKQHAAKYFDALVVPTHPNYDWTRDPGEQPEYVNPVTLNNSEIRWVNAAIRIAERLVVCNKKIAVLKNELKVAEDALDDFEQELLRSNPAPSSATKSLKLLDAYLKKIAFDVGSAKDYSQLIDGIRSKQRALTLQEVEADNCRFVWQTLKLAGDHAMTHLSFVKHELEKSGKGV